ncbi:hypothetical protein HDU76_004933 [Blyttiomyces sp. JEL0837]|nr:hypothetical protein HDU76_004933 [Blyttiomyces sp. JEL0837]
MPSPSSLHVVTDSGGRAGSPTPEAGVNGNGRSNGSPTTPTTTTTLSSSSSRSKRHLSLPVGTPRKLMFFSSSSKSRNSTVQQSQSQQQQLSAYQQQEQESAKNNSWDAPSMSVRDLDTLEYYEEDDEEVRGVPVVGHGTSKPPQKSLQQDSPFAVPDALSKTWSNALAKVDDDGMDEDEDDDGMSLASQGTTGSGSGSASTDWLGRPISPHQPQSNLNGIGNLFIRAKQKSSNTSVTSVASSVDSTSSSLSGVSNGSGGGPFVTAPSSSSSSSSGKSGNSILGFFQRSKGESGSNSGSTTNSQDVGSSLINQESQSSNSSSTTNTGGAFQLWMRGGKNNSNNNNNSLANTNGGLSSTTARTSSEGLIGNGSALNEVLTGSRGNGVANLMVTPPPPKTPPPPPMPVVDPIRLAFLTTYKLNQERLEPRYDMRRLVQMQNILAAIYGSWSDASAQHDGSIYQNENENDNENENSDEHVSYYDDEGEPEEDEEGDGDDDDDVFLGQEGIYSDGDDEDLERDYRRGGVYVDHNGDNDGMIKEDGDWMEGEREAGDEAGDGEDYEGKQNRDIEMEGDNHDVLENGSVEGVDNSQAANGTGLRKEVEDMMSSFYTLSGPDLSLSPSSTPQLSGPSSRHSLPANLSSLKLPKSIVLSLPPRSRATSSSASTSPPSSPPSNSLSTSNTSTPPLNIQNSGPPPLVAIDAPTVEPVALAAEGAYNEPGMSTGRVIAGNGTGSSSVLPSNGNVTAGEVQDSGYSSPSDDTPLATVMNGMTSGNGGSNSWSSPAKMSAQDQVSAGSNNGGNMNGGGFGVADGGVVKSGGMTGSSSKSSGETVAEKGKRILARSMSFTNGNVKSSRETPSPQPQKQQQSDKEKESDKDNEKEREKRPLLSRFSFMSGAGGTGGLGGRSRSQSASTTTTQEQGTTSTKQLGHIPLPSKSHAASPDNNNADRPQSRAETLDSNMSDSESVMSILSDASNSSRNGSVYGSLRKKMSFSTLTDKVKRIINPSSLNSPSSATSTSTSSSSSSNAPSSDAKTRGTTNGIFERPPLPTPPTVTRNESAGKIAGITRKVSIGKASTAPSRNVDQDSNGTEERTASDVIKFVARKSLDMHRAMNAAVIEPSVMEDQFIESPTAEPVPDIPMQYIEAVNANANVHPPISSTSSSSQGSSSMPVQIPVRVSSVGMLGSASPSTRLPIGMGDLDIEAFTSDTMRLSASERAEIMTLLELANQSVPLPLPLEEARDQRGNWEGVGGGMALGRSLSSSSRTSSDGREDGAAHGGHPHPRRRSRSRSRSRSGRNSGGLSSYSSGRGQSNTPTYHNGRSSSSSSASNNGHVPMITSVSTSTFTSTNIPSVSQSQMHSSLPPRPGSPSSATAPPLSPILVRHSFSEPQYEDNETMITARKQLTRSTSRRLSRGSNNSDRETSPGSPSALGMDFDYFGMNSLSPGATTVNAYETPGAVSSMTTIISSSSARSPSSPPQSPSDRSRSGWHGNSSPSNQPQPLSPPHSSSRHSSRHSSSQSNGNANAVASVTSSSHQRGSSSRHQGSSPSPSPSTPTSISSSSRREDRERHRERDPNRERDRDGERHRERSDRDRHRDRERGERSERSEKKKKSKQVDLDDVFQLDWSLPLGSPGSSISSMLTLPGEKK